MKKPIFNWNPEDKIASCIITDKEKIFYGTASCHPDDEDMMGEKTGCEIAFKRASIKLFRSYRDELKIELKTLEQLYYAMNRSKNFNKKSYETKMLLRAIRRTKNDLAEIKSILINEEQSLKSYIENKDKFYKRIRKNRQIEDKDNSN